MENERIKQEIGECQDIALGVPLQGLLDQQSENRLQRHENDEPPPTAMPISSSTPLLDVPINEENEDAQLGSGQDTISQNRDVNEHPNVARQSQSMSNIVATNSGHSSSTHPPFQVRDSPQLQITRQNLHAQAQRIPSQESMRHTEYCGVHCRLQSFCHWPAAHLVDKESLADAGFFYLGNRDECRCHHCGVNLHNWEAGDDAFVEHALWSPQCPYLRRQKGEAFVRAVQELAQLGGRVTKEEVERRLQENAGLVQENLLNDETFEQDPLPVGNTEGEQSQVEHQDESVIQATVQLRDRHTELNPCPEALFCRICRDSRVRVLVLPCFHLVVCSGCAPSCQRCPVCYQPIQTTLNVQLRDTADEAD